MKSTQLSLNKLDRRLAAYAAAGVALAAPAMSPSAQANIVYSGPLALAVPQNGIGIYLDFAVGTGTPAAAVPGYDINFYGTTALTFFRPSTTTLESTTTSAAPSALAFGTLIGPTAVFSTSSSPINFQVAGTEYLGVKFNNTNLNTTDYGWIQLATGTAGTGYPAVILGYAYENTGAALTAGQTTAVPEPGTTAALGLGALALGAVGVRRLRQSKQAVA